MRMNTDRYDARSYRKCQSMDAGKERKSCNFSSKKKRHQRPEAGATCLDVKDYPARLRMFFLPSKTEMNWRYPWIK